ncbi:MAG: efflux RND transporter periplasmic adaptor subunit [Pirellulaceae bacterium]
MLKTKLGIIGLALVPLAIGLAVGLTVPLDFIRNRIASSLDDTESDGADHAAQAGAADRVALSPTSQASMDLQMAPLEWSEYQSSYEVPAFVREIPGADQFHVASRFAGLVRQVFISEGQSVKAGDPILEIELTGDLLATAQADLLAAKEQTRIVEKQIDRLQPVVDQGGIAQKKLLEFKYERDRLAIQIATKTQELLVRGLTKEQIEEIILTKQLLRSVTVRVPENLIPPQLNAGEVMKQADETFVVEQLLAKPGAMAQLGDNLCELSFHGVLAVEGQAYEMDLPEIRRLIDERTSFTISIGPDGAEHEIRDQHIAYLSNHVDEATNTYPFYVYLKNEKLFVDSAGQTDSPYIAWQWKPGQRAHIELPDRVFEKNLVIPREALAIDGLRHYVFRWNGIVEPPGHAHEPGEDHSDHEHFDEFQAIEVVVLHRDRNKVVIERGEELRLGDRIAMNNASQLLFAMQVGSGGGGNHHGHSH